MSNPIHVLHDGTHIDLGQIIEISPVRATENVQYPAVAPHVNKSELRFWFDVVFKDVASPRRYVYSMIDIIGTASFNAEMDRQYKTSGLDSRNHNVVLSRTDAALAQEAFDIMAQHRRSLTDAWIAYRNSAQIHEDSAFIRLRQALLDRQQNGGVA